MAGFTEADILGRRIELLFVKDRMSLLANGRIYVCNQNPYIAPSGKTCIAYVSVLLTSGSAAGATDIAFGTGPGTSGAAVSWTGGTLNFLAYQDSPAMFFPVATASLRPTAYSNGTEFWVNPGINTPFNAGTSATIKIYGWAF
jgi:hypothetical protein